MWLRCYRSTVIPCRAHFVLFQVDAARLVVHEQQLLEAVDDLAGLATCREQEATSNLSAVLTGSTLMTMFVLRKLGLALADLDELTSKTGYEGKTQATNMFTGKGTSVSEEGIEKAE